MGSKHNTIFSSKGEVDHSEMWYEFWNIWTARNYFVVSTKSLVWSGLDEA